MAGQVCFPSDLHWHNPPTHTSLLPLPGREVFTCCLGFKARLYCGIAWNCEFLFCSFPKLSTHNHIPTPTLFPCLLPLTSSLSKTPPWFSAIFPPNLPPSHPQAAVLSDIVVLYVVQKRHLYWRMKYQMVNEEEENDVTGTINAVNKEEKV